MTDYHKSIDIDHSALISAKVGRYVILILPNLIEISGISSVGSVAKFSLANYNIVASVNREMKINRSKIKLISLILLGLCITVLFILLMVPDSPVQKVTISTMESIKKLPTFWGCLIITIVYAISLVFCFPGTPINLAAGYMFGVVAGSVATVVGCDLGAVLAFFVGRLLTREWAAEQIKNNKKYSQIDQAVEKNSLLIIFLLRLSPVIPFGICNYIFGATKVKFSKYWIATTAGLIPCTVAYTYLGSLMRSLADIYAEGSDETDGQLIFITVATIFTVVIIAVITFVTKRTLSKAMNEDVELENIEIDLDMKHESLLMQHDDSHSEVEIRDNEYIIRDEGRVEKEYTFEHTNKRLD
ncbi:hypothetical protein PPL_03229 [Heterostelium album PN500]|uniref:VTT domain-containing protein n=1 Tax=Heterostelium pallidum (strain ATCC 26659 / Pp 5 / PN500) TaxID=670386 RepID=D3B4A7_HETP5|nr:hypothetical protein PPL_03229 [Heterostelium album PN500]EFA84155.1 hypothetical protein PPL_03229 [Heterostelium album PN500]|eukprot:XP_020436272.1 hypothetical protein PPL_03229 [Heterostelium album PN500]